MYSDEIKVGRMRRMQLSGRKHKVETMLTFHVYKEPHITKRKNLGCQKHDAIANIFEEKVTTYLPKSMAENFRNDSQYQQNTKAETI